MVQTHSEAMSQLSKAWSTGSSGRTEDFETIKRVCFQIVNKKVQTLFSLRREQAVSSLWDKVSAMLFC
jgi:hypothetical protein